MIAEVGQDWLVITSAVMLRCTALVIDYGLQWESLLGVGRYLILPLVQKDGNLWEPFPFLCCFSCAAFFICEKEEEWLYRLTVVCCMDSINHRIKIKILLLSRKFNKESVSTEAVITGG